MHAWILRRWCRCRFVVVVPLPLNYTHHQVLTRKFIPHALNVSSLDHQNCGAFALGHEIHIITTARQAKWYTNITLVEMSCVVSVVCHHNNMPSPVEAHATKRYVLCVNVCDSINGPHGDFFCVPTRSRASQALNDPSRRRHESAYYLRANTVNLYAHKSPSWTILLTRVWRVFNRLANVAAGIWFI